MPLRDVKYAILELDGVELDVPTEKPIAAEDVSYTNANFTSDNLQDVVEEAANKSSRVTINQTAHGFTLPSYGILPVYYDNNTSQYVEANANSVDTAADALVVEIVDVDNFVIQESGVLNVAAHGLDVGKWHVLQDGVAGQLIAEDAQSTPRVQYLAYPVNADNILLRPDPIFFREVFVPQDISVLEDWVQGTDPTLTAGTDRLLIVGVTWEDLGTAPFPSVSSIEVGGQTGTLIIEQSVIATFQNASSKWYFTDAQIEAMTNNVITINWNVRTPGDLQTFNAILEGVDQVNPIVQTNSDSGTGGTDTLDADVNALAGGYVTVTCAGGNTGMGFTNNGTGFTRKLNLTLGSADGVVDDKLITADATPENCNITVTGSNRHELLAASFRRRES